MENVKRCSQCGRTLPLDCFGLLSRSKDGHRASCKECRHLEYAANIEHFKAKRREYYHQNKDSLMKAQKVRFSNPEKAEQRRAYNKAYYKAHKESIKANVRESARARKKSDPAYKLICHCRTRMYKALKGIAKPASTLELIGCTIEELKGHLEAQFSEGMSWENYGKWHVDHIRPCASFDFTNEADIRACFHYSNLQPLWAEDNLLKHDKYQPR